MPKANEKLKAWLADESPETLLADGLDEALIGFVRQFSRYIALYDYRKCIELLEEQGATNEEAVEHLEYNTLGAWAGEYTPVFIDRDFLMDFGVRLLLAPGKGPI